MTFIYSEDDLDAVADILQCPEYERQRLHNQYRCWMYATCIFVSGALTFAVFSWAIM